MFTLPLYLVLRVALTFSKIMTQKSRTRMVGKKMVPKESTEPLVSRNVGKIDLPPLEGYEEPFRETEDDKKNILQIADDYAGADPVGGPGGPGPP